MLTSRRCTVTAAEACYAVASKQLDRLEGARWIVRDARIGEWRLTLSLSFGSMALRPYHADELVTLERAVATQTDHAHSLEQRLAAREIELAEELSLLATAERKARNHLEALEAERERHALLELRNTVRRAAAAQ